MSKRALEASTRRTRDYDPPEWAYEPPPSPALWETEATPPTLIKESNDSEGINKNFRQIQQQISARGQWYGITGNNLLTHDRKELYASEGNREYTGFLFHCIIIALLSKLVKNFVYSSCALDEWGC